MFPGMGYGGQGMMGLMYPQLMGPERQMAYGQALLGQAADASAVRSPYQALARALSGVLGGYEMNQGQQAAVVANQQMQQQAQDFVRTSFGSPFAPQPTSAPAQSAPAAASSASVQPPQNFSSLYDSAATSSGIPRNVLVAKDSLESNFDNNAVSKTGARGIPQILPSTANTPGYGMQPLGEANITNPDQAIPFAANYLAARGKDLFGANWNPADPVQLREALKAYGDGTNAYADSVLQHAGLGADSEGRYVVAQNTGSAGTPDAGAGGGDQANAWMAYQTLMQRAAAARMNPNPYVQSIAPMLEQQAQLALKSFSSPQKLAEGVYGQTDAFGKLNISGRPIPPESQRMQTLNTLLPMWKANPASLNPQQLQELETAVSTQWPSKSEYDQHGRVVTYQPTPQPADVPTVDQIEAVRTGKGAAAAPGGPQAPTMQTPPGQTPQQMEAEKAGYDKAVEGAQDYLNKTSDALADAGMLRGNMQQIRNRLDVIQTGWGATAKSEISSFLHGIGANTNEFDAANLGDVQIERKLFLESVFSRVKQMGSREAAQVINMASNAFPDIEKQPNAIDFMSRLLDMEQTRMQERNVALGNWLANQKAVATSPGHRLAEFKGVQDFASSGWDAANDPKIYAAVAQAASLRNTQQINAANALWRRGLSQPQQDQVINGLHKYYPAEYQPLAGAAAGS